VPAEPNREQAVSTEHSFGRSIVTEVRKESPALKPGMNLTVADTTNWW